MKQIRDVESLTPHSRTLKKLTKKTQRVKNYVFPSDKVDLKPGMMLCTAFERQHKSSGNMLRLFTSTMDEASDMSSTRSLFNYSRS